MYQKNYWVIYKTVLPQHTDHAGIMWHGTYLNWLEEARIDALQKAGINYGELALKGYEMPVVELLIKYRKPISLGENIMIKSKFIINSSPKIDVQSNFIDYSNNNLTSSNVSIVLIKKENSKIVRNRPNFLSKAFENLHKGYSKLD